MRLKVGGMVDDWGRGRGGFIGGGGGLWLVEGWVPRIDRISAVRRGAGWTTQMRFGADRWRGGKKVGGERTGFGPRARVGVSPWREFEFNFFSLFSKHKCLSVDISFAAKHLQYFFFESNDASLHSSTSLVSRLQYMELIYYYMWDSLLIHDIIRRFQDVQGGRRKKSQLYSIPWSMNMLQITRFIGFVLRIRTSVTIPTSSLVLSHVWPLLCTVWMLTLRPRIEYSHFIWEARMSFFDGKIFTGYVGRSPHKNLLVVTTVCNRPPPKTGVVAIMTNTYNGAHQLTATSS